MPGARRVSNGLARAPAYAPHCRTVRSPSRTPRRQAPRGAVGVARAVVALALALAVLVPAAFGGLGFVWCAPMGRAMARSCCPATRHAHAPPAVEQPCCEGHRVASLPAFRSDLAHDPWVAPPPLVALLALAWLFAVASPLRDTLRGARVRRARDGPSPPLYLLHCSLRN